MKNIPHRLFLEITTECNLYCKICKLWKQKDPLDKINLETKLNFLQRFFEWIRNFNGANQKPLSVILTGGEPFLFPNQIFEISHLCQENGVKSYVNTNGSLIKNKLDRILNSTLTALTISIDSHLSKIHDNLRERIGLFDTLIKILKDLRCKKKENGYPIKIYIQSILGNWNIGSLEAHINFFKDLDIDGIMFQPIQYPFGLQIPNGWYLTFDKFPHYKDDIQYAINYLLKEKQYNGFVMNSKEEIELWKFYFENPEYLSDSINPCRSFEQNMIVDVCGNVKFCFNRELVPETKIGNILTTSIDKLWTGKNALEEKNMMRLCNRACGVMACHIDTNFRKD
ncbi:MAG: radical SAM protein [Promethearchaeota archaeon]